MKEKKVLWQILQDIEFLATNCSEHLQKQHQQGPNDKPRFYFDNIAKNAIERRKKLDVEEA